MKMPYMSGKKWLMLLVVLVLGWHVMGGRISEGLANAPTPPKKDAKHAA